MAKVDELKKHLKKGDVYRREDLAAWSTAVDRHVDILMQEGVLKKLSQGLYYYPKETAFGAAPPGEKELLESFLKDSRFLVTTPNAYNSLGVGTTQLYNTKTVYNHKRHGEITLGNRKYNFQVKHHFPSRLTQEFLLVDLVNNLEKLAEDHETVLKNVSAKVSSMNKKKLQENVKLYGNSGTKKVLAPLLM